MKKKLLIFVLAFCFAASVFLTHFAVVGSGVWGDGQFYYSYLRSIVIDHDLNFRNELEHFSREVKITSTGMVANKYAIGSAILWFPFFLTAHFITWFISLIGSNLTPDGYSFLYQVFTGLGSVFYGILGLWFCFLTIKKYYQEKIALLSTFGLWLSSNLFFYTTVDPINSHSVSFFISSIIVFFLSSTSKRLFKKCYSERSRGIPACAGRFQLPEYRRSLHAPRQTRLSRDDRASLILGVLMGLLTLIRNQDVIFVIPIVFLFLSTPGEYLLMFIFSFSLTFLPQLFVWQHLYGQWQNPYLIGGEQFYWLTPKIFSVFFSQNNGLFYYSPILILALIGLFYFYKKDRKLTLSFFLLFIVQTYIISSWHDWHGGASYGGRMFISLYPFFIIGLAGFMDRLKKQMKILLPTFFFFVVLNFISIIKFLLSN